MKKKLFLRKETVAMLDRKMNAVRGGNGSAMCNSYLHDDKGYCLMTYTCPDTYICPVPAQTEKCVSAGADICMVTYDGNTCIDCQVEIM